MVKYGVTETGFRKKTYYDVLEELQNDIRSMLGNDINLSNQTILGRYVEEKAWRESEYWEELEETYYSSFIDTAEGVNLDYASKFIGTSRRLAQKSRGYQVFKGRTGTKIGSGYRISDTNINLIYETMKNGEIDDTGEVIIPIVAIETGSKYNVGKSIINTLVNPIPGITETYNESDIIKGIDVESDYEYRLRNERSVSKGGSTTRVAVESALLDLDSVTDAYVRENESMKKIDGLPPKSLGPIVFGGEDDEIAMRILESKAGGIKSFGEIELNVKDSKGESHVIGFTRPKIKEVYINLKIKIAEGYPGDSQIKDSVINYIGGVDSQGNNQRGLKLGEDVILSRIMSATMCNGGVEDIEIGISLSNGDFKSENIAIGRLDIANTSLDKVVISYV